MTDETERRAERALRAALTTRGDAFESVALEPGPRRRRSGALLLAAAAAVLVVIGGVAAVAGLPGDSPAGRPADGREDGAVPARGEDIRTVSFRGVAVDVPDTWPDDFAPGPDWCTGSWDPAEPYVARDASSMGVDDIKCPGTERVEGLGPVPERLWAPHVSLVQPRFGIADGVQTYRGWTLTAETTGGVQVQVLADRATQPLVDDILGSVRAEETDGSSCDSTSPAQAVEFVRPDPAFDVTEIGQVDEIVVCLYDRTAGTARPGLAGSRVIEAAEAARVLRAIQAAPAGGGPDRPQNCAADDYGDRVLVLRLRTGSTVREMYVYEESCIGNGFDDGTTKRELTAEACMPLWGGRVAAYVGHSASFRRCNPPG